MAAIDSERYEIERTKWDAHAHHAPAKIKPIPADLDFESYCRGDRLVIGIAEFLGDLHGAKVIEYGCGLGFLSILLARSGAEVTAIDISEASVGVARAQAETYGVAKRINFVISPAEQLPFADGTFDLAFGKAVLHHLDPTTAAPEMARILRPGGRAAFSEPLGTNVAVIAARKYVPYPHKHERGADIPLRRSDITAWKAPFRQAELVGVQMLSMIERGFGFSKAFPALRRADDALLERWPGLWPLCRYGVLTMTA